MSYGVVGKSVCRMWQRFLCFQYPVYAPVLSGLLISSHYCELLSISDLGKRSCYEKEAVLKDWHENQTK
jgi:hypothetical protein